MFVWMLVFNYYNDGDVIPYGVYSSLYLAIKAALKQLRKAEKITNISYKPNSKTATFYIKNIYNEEEFYCEIQRTLLDEE